MKPDMLEWVLDHNPSRDELLAELKRRRNRDPIALWPFLLATASAALLVILILAAGAGLAVAYDQYKLRVVYGKTLEKVTRPAASSEAAADSPTSPSPHPGSAASTVR